MYLVPPYDGEAIQVRNVIEEAFELPQLSSEKPYINTRVLFLQQDNVGACCDLLLFEAGAFSLKTIGHVQLPSGGNYARQVDWYAPDYKRSNSVRIGNQLMDVTTGVFSPLPIAKPASSNPVLAYSQAPKRVSSPDRRFTAVIEKRGLGYGSCEILSLETGSGATPLTDCVPAASVRRNGSTPPTS